ncbi:DNA primase, partial [Nocardia sp. NPDC003963]
GDVFGFLQKHQQIGFPEAVQMAADRIGYTIRYEGGGTSLTAQRQRDTRARLVAANTDAAQYYSEHLGTHAGASALRFLTDRGFDDTVITTFGCGFAPKSWDGLTKHLRSKGYTEEELTTAGLSQPGRLGLIDRFRGRLMWPIRNPAGEVLGFGARRIFDDDPIEVKYLNTRETPLYKKSQVLFGLDLARRQIGNRHMAIVVEGYTDVMAMHAAGIPHAVATCGTAFGEPHLNALRRILLDDSTWRGEICYLFDGDKAGRTAATRAFAHVKAIPGRATVAIAPGDLDPCELWQRDGEHGLHDLLARRSSLLGFVLKAAIAEHNLEDIDGRVAAMHHGISILAELPDPMMRTEYGRKLAELVGVDPTAAVSLLRESGPAPSRDAPVSPTERARSPGPLRWQHGALQAALQHPQLAAAHGFDDLDPEVFTDPDCARIHAAITDLGGVAGAPADAGRWAHAVLDHLGAHADTAAALAAEPLRLPDTEPGRHVGSLLVKLTDQYLADRKETLRAELKSCSPQHDPHRFSELTMSISDIEQRRRTLLAAHSPHASSVAPPSASTSTASSSSAAPGRRRIIRSAAQTSGPRRPRL